MKARQALTPQQARENLYSQGVSIAQWAEREGYSRNLVYSILQGRRLCRFGKSHQIAVKLGIKARTLGYE